MVNIGVVQGRLSKPVYGHIQEFPFDTWEREFDLLPKLGLSHIEWIVTKESFDKNPVFKRDLSDYPISAICLDNFIDIRYTNEKFWEQEVTSVLDAVDSWKKPVPIIIPITEPWQKEMGFIFFKSKKILKSILLETSIDSYSYYLPYDAQDLAFVFDTGNLTASNQDYAHHLSRISTIHLKDRLKDGGKSVSPLTGDTDFKQIFNLFSQSYKKENLIWTLQTARGLAGLEQETVYYHKCIFEKLINEYFL